MVGDDLSSRLDCEVGGEALEESKLALDVDIVCNSIERDNVRILELSRGITNKISILVRE